MAKPDPIEPVARGMLDKAIDAILGGVGGLFKNLRGRLEGIDKRFDEVDRRFDMLEGGQPCLKDWSSAIS